MHKSFLPAFALSFLVLISAVAGTITVKAWSQSGTPAPKAGDAPAKREILSNAQILSAIENDLRRLDKHPQVAPRRPRIHIIQINDPGANAEVLPHGRARYLFRLQELIVRDAHRKMGILPLKVQISLPRSQT